MINRVWCGAAKPESADEYVNHLKQRIFPELKNIEGFRGANILRRQIDDGYEFMIITSWDSIEAIQKFAGEDAETAVLPPEARALLYSYEPKVRHYTVMD